MDWISFWYGVGALALLQLFASGMVFWRAVVNAGPDPDENALSPRRQ